MGSISNTSNMVEEVEEAVQCPADDWKGRCYEIASKAVENVFFQAKAVYGHYYGPVSEDGYFAYVSDAQFVQHGWIEKDNQVIDPTRWVFENKDPYIYFGPNDSDYDRAGERFRSMLHRPPPNDLKGDTFTLQIDQGAKAHVLAILGEMSQRNHFYFNELIWLANAPREVLEPYEEEILRAIDGAGSYTSSLISIDRRERVLGEKEEIAGVRR